MRFSSQLATLLGGHSPAFIFIVNPIRELVCRYVPVTIGESITKHLYLLCKYPPRRWAATWYS